VPKKKKVESRRQLAGERDALNSFVQLHGSKILKQFTTFTSAKDVFAEIWRQLIETDDYKQQLEEADKRDRDSDWYRSRPFHVEEKSLEAMFRRYIPAEQLEGVTMPWLIDVPKSHVSHTGKVKTRVYERLRIAEATIEEQSKVIAKLNERVEKLEAAVC
jgi:hypothetical protein